MSEVSRHTMTDAERARLEDRQDWMESRAARDELLAEQTSAEKLEDWMEDDDVA